MPAPVSDADLAFTYAWWLTGDTGAAEAAVRRALETLSGQGAPHERRLELLAAVRAGAIDRPTMCPASELAVLHDAQGVDLPDAARLVSIDVADARIELAHGRLEALLETVREPFAHPERLGGLAVGNPPDVAHSRQCESCASVERLLREGRDALREIPPPPTPAALRALWEPEEPPAPESEPESEPSAEPESEPESKPESKPESEPEPESESEPSAEPVPPDEAAPVPDTEVPQGAEAAAPTSDEDGPRVLQFVDGALDPLDEAELVPEEPRRRNWLLPTVVALALILLVVTVGTALRPGGQTSPAGQTDDGSSVDPASGDPTGAPPPDGFTIDSVGLIRRGEFTPAGPGIVLTPTDRVRIAVRYAGATDGVLLEGHWTVDGAALRELRVALSSRQSMHVFTAPVPDDGWPRGLHQVVLTVGGTVLGSIDFRVV